MTMSPTSTTLLAPLSPALSDSDTSLTTRRERQRAFDALNGLELSPTSESRSRRQSRRISAILHESPDTPSGPTDDATKRITPTLHASLVSEILSLRREVESRNNLLNSHEETIYHLRNSNTSLLDEIAATNKTTRNLKAQVKLIEGGTLTALEEIAAERDEFGRLLKESRLRVENLKGDVRTVESEKSEISTLLETERTKNTRSEGLWKRKCELAESRLKEVLGEVEHLLSENVLLKTNAVKAANIVAEKREDEDILRRSESLKRPPLVHSDSLADELARLADEEETEDEQVHDKPLVSPTHPPSPPITPKVGSSATMDHRTTHDIGVQVSFPSPSPSPPPVLQKPMLEVPFISIRPPSSQSRPPTSSSIVLPPGTKSVSTQTVDPYPLSSFPISSGGTYTTKSTQTTDLSSRVAELLQKANHNGPSGTSLVKSLRGVNLDDSDDLDFGLDLDLSTEESEGPETAKTEKLDKGKGREVIVPIPASAFPDIQAAPIPAVPEPTKPQETVLKPQTSTSSFLSLSMPFPVPDRSSSRRLQSSKKKTRRRRRPTLDTNDFSDADAERDDSPSRKTKRKSKTLRRMPSGFSSISGLSEISGLSQLSEFTSDFTGSALSGSVDVDVDIHGEGEVSSREFEDRDEKLTGLGLGFEPSLGFADVYDAPQEGVDVEEIHSAEVDDDLLDEEDLSLPPAIATSRTEIEQRNRDSLQVQTQILDRSASRLSAFGSPTSPLALSSAFRKPSAQSVVSGPTSVASTTGQSTIVDAIAQTMIGDWLWKYTRRRLPGLSAAASDSQNLNKNMYGDRHLRWVWLAPYEKCVMWSARQPTSNNALLSGGKGGKRLVIQSVLDVRDDSLLPAQSQTPYSDATEFGRSIVIITPSRALKFTAPNKEKHFIWMTALSFLAHSTVTGEGLDALSMPTNPNSLTVLRQSHLNKARPVVTAKSIRDSLRLPRSERDKLRKALDENVEGPPSRTPPPPPTSGTVQSHANSVEPEIDSEIYNVGAEPPVVPRLSSRDDNRKAKPRGQNAHNRRRSLTNPLPILGALNRLVSSGSNASSTSRPEVTKLNALGNGSKASLAPSQPSTLRYVTNQSHSGSPSRNASKISIVIPGSGHTTTKGASTSTVAAVQAQAQMHDKKEHESPISPTSTTTSTGTGRSLKEEYARLDKIGRERRRTRRMNVAVKV